MPANSWVNRWNEQWKKLDPRLTERWESFMNEGKSPKEIWEIRFRELSEINSKFDSKIPYFEYSPSDTKYEIDENNEHEFIAFEQIGIIFMKPHVRKMQSRWEDEVVNGLKSPEEFWTEERKSFNDKDCGRKSWWSSWDQQGDKHTADCQSKYPEPRVRTRQSVKYVAPVMHGNIQRTQGNLKLFKEFDFF